MGEGGGGWVQFRILGSVSSRELGEEFGLSLWVGKLLFSSVLLFLVLCISCHS